MPSSRRKDHGVKPNRIVIVGASVAGVCAVETLRKEGYDGEVTLLDTDVELPYNRPPLSKELLTGDLDEDDVRLVTTEQLAALRVEALLGTAARSLDVDRRLVGTSEGDIGFDGLIIATGSAPLRPRGWPSLVGVHALRSLDDARRIRAGMTNGDPSVVVVGGGFIGCEVAASARAHGLDTTIVEAQPLPLQRALGPAFAEPIVRLHRDHGVRLLCGVGVQRLLGSRRVEQVELADGTLLQADLVVLGVGAAPVTGWLVGSGLEITDGVATDCMLRTHVPGVYAAGDVARWPYRRSGLIRVEHWTNAKEQGARAAVNLLRPDATKPYVGEPYVWSHQYGRHLQIAGGIHSGQIRFLRGGPDEEAYLALLVDDGLVAGAVGLDCGRDFGRARRLVAEATPWSTLESRSWHLA